MTSPDEPDHSQEGFHIPNGIDPANQVVQQNDLDPELPGRRQEFSLRPVRPPGQDDGLEVPPILEPLARVKRVPLRPADDQAGDDVEDPRRFRIRVVQSPLPAKKNVRRRRLPGQRVRDDRVKKQGSICFGRYSRAPSVTLEVQVMIVDLSRRPTEIT
jgi:hypothetical protein